MDICGANIPENKPIAISLCRVYGVGKTMAKWIARRLGVRSSTLVNRLPTRYRIKLRQIMEQQLKLGDALKRQINDNIALLKSIGCYRGLRHRLGLPARGQRTRSNAHTRKYYMTDDV